VRDVERSDDGGEGWYGDTRGQSLKLMREARNGERASLKRNKGEKRTTKPEPIYIYPESFLILLMGPDLGAVGEGSARHVQRGAMATPGLDVDRSDMGNPRVFSQEGLVRAEQGDLTARGKAPTC